MHDERGARPQDSAAAPVSSTRRETFVRAIAAVKVTAHLTRRDRLQPAKLLAPPIVSDLGHADPANGIPRPTVPVKPKRLLVAVWRRSPQACGAFSAFRSSFMSKDIPQGGPVQWGWINRRCGDYPGFEAKTASYGLWDPARARRACLIGNDSNEQRSRASSHERGV